MSQLFCAWCHTCTLDSSDLIHTVTNGLLSCLAAGTSNCSARGRSERRQHHQQLHMALWLLCPAHLCWPG